MKITRFVSFVVAMTVASSQFAFAQGHGPQRGHDGGRGYQEQRGPDHREMRPSHRNSYGYDAYRRHDYARRYERHDRMDQRWPGPDREYHRGDRLPMEYRQNNYVVDDWRGHRLNQPPRGYRWVQSGADYLLVAVATGLILDILINH